MRKKISLVVVLAALVALVGCASTKEKTYILREADFSGNKPYVVDHASKSVVCKDSKNKPVDKGKQAIDFPQGGLLGISTSKQSNAVASMVEASHNAVINKLDALSEAQDKKHKDTIKRVDAVEEALNAKIVSLDASQRRASESVQDVKSSLTKEIKGVAATVEELNKRAHQGEITIFFPSGTGNLSQSSNEYKRLVSFLDQMIKGWSGANIVVAVKGNASSANSKQQKLVRQREKAIEKIIAKHLVNTSYEFMDVAVMGVDVKEATAGNTGEQYQNVRVMMSMNGDVGVIVKLLQEESIRQVSPKPEISKSHTSRMPIEKTNPVPPQAKQPDSSTGVQAPPHKSQGTQPAQVKPLSQPASPQGQNKQPQPATVMPQFTFPAKQPTERSDKDINSVIKEGLQQFPPKPSK